MLLEFSTFCICPLIKIILSLVLNLGLEGYETTILGGLFWAGFLNEIIVWSESTPALFFPYIFTVLLPSFIKILFASKIFPENVKLLCNTPFNLNVTLLAEDTFKMAALILTYKDGELNGLSPGLVIFTFGFGVTTGL